MNDFDTVDCTFDERAIRALHSAVCFTLQNWGGQGAMDQEELLCLKPFLQGTIFEFDFHKDDASR